MQVDCFEEAPAEWSRKSISELSVVDPTYELEVGKSYPFVEMGSVQEGFAGISRYDSRVWDRSGLCRFAENDILIGKITPCAENGKAALVRGLPDVYGIGSTEFFVLSPNSDVDPEFLFALVMAGPFHKRLVSRMEGSTGRLRITRDTLKKWLAVPLPSPEEQRNISAALRSVNDAIQKTKNELEATRRLKKSLMQQLFTQGMPGKHAQFQETKIGKFPTQWRIEKGKELFLLGSSSNTYPDYFDSSGDCAFLKVDDFNQKGNERIITSPTLRFISSENTKIKLYEPGCVCFAKRGAAILKNRVRILGERSAIDPNLMVLMPYKNKILSDFMAYYLDYFKLGRLCEDAGLPQLNNRDLYPRLFPQPKIDEQEEIVEVIFSVDRAISAVEQQLITIVKMKKSLLQHLLTGKVRVKMEK